MEENQYVTLKNFSEQIGLDRSNARKWLLGQGFEFVRVRDQESRQMVNALTLQDAQDAFELRGQQGFIAQEAATASPVVSDGTGFFYVIRLMPDVAPNRIKIGFASALQPRIAAHRCTCPKLEVLKTWPCRKTYEAAAIAVARNGTSVLYGGEVYDVESVEEMIVQLDTFFSMVT